MAVNVKTITCESVAHPIEAVTLTDLTATVTELNTLDGITATTTELNYCDGVTSNIQTQLDAKQATLTAGTNVSISGTTISATDTNTTYTVSSGANQITLTPSTGTASTADITSKDWGSFTFTTAGWTDDTSTSGYYIQTLSVIDMTGADFPTLIPTYASASVVSDVQTALSKVASITTAAGSITAYATEAPTTPITFKLVGR